MIKTNVPRAIDRRQFLVLAGASLLRAEERVTCPVVSEDACPLERIVPQDGHPGLGLMRKPPGEGPFPVIFAIHGGLVTWPEEKLRQYSLNGATPSRFLAAGYVVPAITYRSRDEDPQSKVSLEDCLAAIDHVRRFPFVDPKSIVVYGCSGGGDLALQVPMATDVCVIVSEEPASVMMTGIFNATSPKQGQRYTAADIGPIWDHPKRYYTPEYQKITRAKIDRIRCPILIIQSDQHPINRFNAEVLIPELRARGKTLEVITYPGEPHCFFYWGSGPRTPRPAAALKIFNAVDAFCKRYLPTKPKPIDSRLVKLTPLDSA